MVSTRRSARKDASKKPEAIKAEPSTPVAEPPHKRQKRSHRDKKGIDTAVKLENSTNIPVPEVVAVVNGSKGSKKAKKLLQTLHTDEELPAVKAKASQVALVANL